MVSSSARVCFRLLAAAVAAWVLIASVADAGPARAATVLATDDFERGDLSGGTGWLDDWQLAGSGEVTVGSGLAAHSGAGYLKVVGGGTSVSRTADVTTYPSVRASFWARLDGGDDDDGGGSTTAQFSADGTAWTIVKRWSDQDDDDGDDDDDDDDDGRGGWRKYQFVVPASAGGVVSLRFSAEPGRDSDDDGDDDGGAVLLLDDIVVEDAVAGESGGGPGTGRITVDSQFADWAGQAFLPDPYGDSTGGVWHDLDRLYWANNLDEEVNYHMILRHTADGQPYSGSNGQQHLVFYLLHMDTNNNGNFREAADRAVQVSYEPKNTEGVVRVRVRRANDLHLISDTGRKDWGETKAEGGLRVEFPLSWDDLGIEFGAVVRMYLESHTGGLVSRTQRDRLPDGVADIQWSPASVLGPWLLAGALALGLGVVWYFRGRRVWRSG